MVGPGDGVFFIQNGIHGPGHSLAVVNVHAALLVEVQPQEILAALPDILHVPQLAAVSFHNGAGEFRHQFRHLHWRANLLQAKKKERRSRLSLPTFYHLTSLLYHRTR